MHAQDLYLIIGNLIISRFISSQLLQDDDEEDDDDERGCMCCKNKLQKQLTILNLFFTRCAHTYARLWHEMKKKLQN